MPARNGLGMVASDRGVAVVYDYGAVGPYRIHAALSDLARIVYVMPRSEHNMRVFPLVAALGPVVEVPPGEFLGSVVSRLRAERVLHVVTFSESCQMLAAHLAAALDGRADRINVATAVTDKVVQRRTLRRSGVDPTRSAIVRSTSNLVDAVRDIGTPGVLKPATGFGSNDVRKITSLSEAVREFQHMTGRRNCVEDPLVYEEFLVGLDRGHLRGDYVAVESIVGVNGEIEHFGVTGKFPLAPALSETGAFVPNGLNTAEESAVRRLASNALQALGVKSAITHTEVKLTVTGPRIIEVNGRVGGHVDDLMREWRSWSPIRRFVANLCGVNDPAVRREGEEFTFYVFVSSSHIADPAERRMAARRLVEQSSAIRFERNTAPARAVAGGTLAHGGTIWGKASSWADVCATVDYIEAELGLHGS